MSGYPKEVWLVCGAEGRERVYPDKVEALW